MEKKELCNGKIDINGICGRCYQVSQTTSGYCTRLIDIVIGQPKENNYGSDCLNIALKTARECSPIKQPERTAEEFIKSKYPQDYDDIPKWHLEDMHEYASQCNLPSEEESNDELEKESFRVPYDGSDNFYDESFIKGWQSCYEWMKSRIKK